MHHTIPALRGRNEIRKWDLLAEATGRKNMTWRVTKDSSECQWFGGAGGNGGHRVKFHVYPDSSSIAKCNRLINCAFHQHE